MASQEAHDPPPFDMESLADQLRDLGYEERSAICIEKFKQHPKKIALFLKAAHLGIPSPARAFFCQVFEKILEDEEVPDSTFREVCTNGLLDVLIDIALDARIYMWNKPTSSFYYPWLGLPKTRKLWPLLWINRQLFENNKENLVICSLSGERYSPAAFRDLVVSCIWHMLMVHSRFTTKPEIPTWAGGVDEIFLYSWQYTSPTSKMHTDVIAILAIYLPMRSTEEAKRIITKVVVDEKIARGILYPIYYRLEQCYTTSARILSDSLICLQYILYFSPILRNVAAKDARFFRTVTSACQYSICSTEDSNHRMACLQEGFLAILTVIKHAPLALKELGRTFFLKDLDSAAKLARMGSKILPTLPGLKCDELQGK
ncbi:hypothetical protein NLI96_g3259 [Meripilus lineatus]|uniref:Uncharacterized protein n=1 Tax=Meripilus lineatus TaxID=2056292 RepID=A0AAD5VCH8_9APHY|nr:hypothetical protein NLI96_g3259 [Physisporinus lineatus]